ncbi:MAG TPA: DUF1592 domain-containing protein, partial [Polyangia bacterium]|nr:DUF1592 domain-containing protein [Polyangia bacterium]
MGRTALRKAARNTAFVIFSAALGGSGCTGDVGALADGGSNSGSGGGKGSGGASQSGSGGANDGSGGSSQSGSGGSSQSGSGGSSQNGSGGASQTGSGGASQSGSGGATLACNSISPGRSPLRRLTTYEYNNTVKDLLSDATSPGSMLPAQVDSKQNLFGNDADQQSPSPLLIEKYQSVAESIAARATANATALGKLHSCAASVTTANEESCARMVATTLAPRAYRRTVTTSEVDELVALYKSVRAISTVTFASGVAAMIEAMLQAPDFLYRPEFGTSVASNTSVRRIAGREMATRLSYFFWQTMPDPAMFQAADAGMLDSNDGVRQYAQKLLDDPKSHATVAFFFDNLLPIPDLAGTGREASLFPTWSSSIGAAMRSEIQRVLEYEIFENTAQSAAPYATGSWPAILTLPYTFVNQALYSFYGPSTFASGTSAVTGTALKKVDLNTDQRRGLLTLGGFGAGSSVSNLTNPVLRGSFIVNKVMCRTIDLPTGFTPMPP